VADSCRPDAERAWEVPSDDHSHDRDLRVEDALRVVARLSARRMQE
jgi:hypothetical protein